MILELSSRDYYILQGYLGLLDRVCDGIALLW